MAPAEGDFDGNDFAYSLFSDLVPLLTLFGEQVTKQFLSLSMGWAGNILLAMGPLRILTIDVGVIRVGGVTGLKAIIGRVLGPEKRPTAEMELLSSTSLEVCELWTGREIVRLRGQPQMSLPIIITADARILPFDEGPSAWKYLRLKRRTPDGAGLATYYWNWDEIPNPGSTYGYPCYLVGTILHWAGVAFCGHVVESASMGNPFRCTPAMRKNVHYARPASLFVVQFTGLRGSRWSAAVVQLGVTLIMTGRMGHVPEAMATGTRNLRADMDSKPGGIHW
ncbi:hypothetical protein N657DRAFT_653213 [Parathielavia appendiculata]|uniref:Uncharacterized protein n=1 Tax=Parathielavia appendiculata TaxID=2587402 RepID=A0AAN6U603_9PEZI|nr:hypothetical protein N657DRAFT_653213 [Parathielavia appendiculata]